MITMDNTYYDFEKTTRRGVTDNDGNTPRLVFGMANGNPRFTVYLGKDKGLIAFPSDHDTMGAILAGLELMVKADNDAKISFNSKFPERDKSTNEPTGKLISRGTCILGKNKNGEIYIRIEEPTKGAHPFVFRLSDYHDAFENGDTMLAAKTSAFVLRGWIALIQGILANATVVFTKDRYEASDYKPGVMKKAEDYQKGGQNKGGYNKGGYNKGGYNKPNQQPAKPERQDAVSSDYDDDDVPF